MDNCELLIRIVEMDEEIKAEINSVSIAGRSMLYPVHRVKMLYYSCAANVVDLSNFNLLTTEGNLLPRRIFVAMLREEAMHGNYGRDPFNYQHFNLNFASKLVHQKSHFLFATQENIYCNAQRRGNAW